MKNYREFQLGSLGLAFFVPAHLLVFFLYFAQFGIHPIELTEFLLFNCGFVLLYLLFYGMTTIVNDEKIAVSFGIGIIRRNLWLKRIASVDKVKNPWYYGWGIRFFPGGVLYNISGADGVELTFKDTKRVIRIGTKNPIQLRDEIKSRLLK